MIVNPCAEVESLGEDRYRHVQHIRPIAYRNQHGHLRRIQNTLASTGNHAFPLGVDELVQFRIRTRLAGNAPLLHFGRRDTFVRLTPLDTNNVNGHVTDPHVFEYPNAWNNADLRFSVANHILCKEVLLHKGHPASFAFRIDAHAGLDLDTLQTADFRILPPALAHPDPGHDEIALTWSVATQGRFHVLRCHLPPGDFSGWILDPNLLCRPAAEAGKDTTVRRDNQDKNYGTANLHPQPPGADQRNALIQYDLTSIPAGSTITAAYWRGFHMYSGSQDITLHRVLPANDWVELEATWNIRKTGTNWAGGDGDGDADDGCNVSGTDYDATHAAYLDDSTTGWKTYTLDANGLADVSAWVDNPSDNNGFVILVGGGGSPAICSSDYPNSNYHPYFSVDYIPAPSVGGLTTLGAGS